MASSLDIVFLGTFPPQACGLAEYSYDLACALRRRGHKITVLAEQDNKMQPPGRGDYDEFAVYRIWNRKAAYNTPLGLDTVARVLTSAKMKPDIIHIQHEFGLFPTSNLLSFCQAIRTIRHPYLTAHTVLPSPLQTSFHTDLFSPSVIVHTAMQAAIFYARAGIKPYLIPHGCPPPAAPPREREPIMNILCPGFLSPSKNHEEVIHGFALACELLDTGDHDDVNIHLTIAGEPRLDGYLEKVEEWLKVFGVEDRVTILAEYQTRQELHSLFSKADCIVLGGRSGLDVKPPYSASGQLHYAISLGKPVLAKNVPIYQDGASILWNTAGELALGIYSLTCNRRVHATLAERALATAATRTWDKVAEMHEDVYRLSL